MSRVYYKQEVFDIKKGNNVVARLSPVKIKSQMNINNLNNFFKTSPHLSSDDIEDFETSLKHSRSLKDDGRNKWV